MADIKPVLKRSKDFWGKGVGQKPGRKAGAVHPPNKNLVLMRMAVEGLAQLIMTHGTEDLKAMCHMWLIKIGQRQEELDAGDVLTDRPFSLVKSDDEMALNETEPKDV